LVYISCSYIARNQRDTETTLASLPFVEKIQSLESDKDNLAETLESSVRRVVESSRLLL